MALILAAAIGCTKNPAQPSADATTTAPVPSLPPNNSQVKNADQPIALVVTNAVSTKTGLTYTFEVATDVAFATKGTDQGRGPRRHERTNEREARRTPGRPGITTGVRAHRRAE